MYVTSEGDHKVGTLDLSGSQNRDQNKSVFLQGSDGVYQPFCVTVSQTQDIVAVCMHTSHTSHKVSMYDT